MKICECKECFMCKKREKILSETQALRKSKGWFERKLMENLIKVLEEGNNSKPVKREEFKFKEITDIEFVGNICKFKAKK